MGMWLIHDTKHINGLVQDGSNSIANALELLQSCTKLLIFSLMCAKLLS